MSLALTNRTIVNAVANVAEQFASGAYLFVSYGLLARYGGLDDIAILSLALLIGNAAQTSNISLGTGLTRYLPQFSGLEDEESIARYIQSALLVSTLFFVGFGLIAYFPFRAFMLTFSSGAIEQNVLALVVPAILFAVFQNIVSVPQSALGALQMGLSRSCISTTTQIAGLLLSFLIIPEYGVVGAIWIRVAQTFALLVAYWVYMAWRIPGLPLVPRVIDRPATKKLLSTGLNMQFMSLCALMVEPISRVYLGWYGTLEQVAYFSMAWRLVTLARGILFAASSAVLPVLGFYSVADTKMRDQVYRRCNELFGYIILTSFFSVAILTPLIGQIWLKTTSLTFYVYVLGLLLGFLPSTITLASYHLSISSGQFRINNMASASMAVISAALGLVLGSWTGGDGVVAAVCAAIAVQGFIMAVGNAKLSGIQPQGFDVIGDLAMLVVGLSAIAIQVAWIGLETEQSLSAWLCSGVLILLTCLVPLVFHKSRYQMISYLTALVR